MKNIRVLHIVPDLNIESGGQSNGCFSLAIALIGACDCVSIFFKYFNRSTFLDYCVKSKDIKKFTYSNKIYCNPYSIFSIIKSQDINIIHIHGMWLPIFLWAFIAGKIAGVKIILSPHGTLLPWDLRRKEFKKRLALKLYQGWILRNVNGFIASSNAEYDSINKLGLRSLIFIIPVPITDSNPITSFDSRASDFKTALFVGRINPGKGIHVLIEAWGSLKPNPGHRLVIAGQATTFEELNYLESLVATVKRLNMDDSILFAGLIEGQDKENFFVNASFFVLPTFSENFGMVVAEALAFSLPVITTHGAPWRDIEDHQCGWWIPIGVEYLKRTLEIALSKSPVELFEMGRKGRELFEEKYSFESIAESTISAYGTLVGVSKSREDCLN